MPIKYDKDTGLYVCYKQPNEDILFDMPLKERMRDTDTISGFVGGYPASTIMGKVVGSSDVTIPSSAYSGTTAQVRIQGGTSGEHYKITVLVTTTLGDTIEGDAMLYVEDF